MHRSRPCSAGNDRNEAHSLVQIPSTDPTPTPSRWGGGWSYVEGRGRLHLQIPPSGGSIARDSGQLVPVADAAAAVEEEALQFAAVQRGQHRRLHGPWHRPQPPGLGGSLGQTAHRTGPAGTHPPHLVINGANRWDTVQRGTKWRFWWQFFFYGRALTSQCCATELASSHASAAHIFRISLMSHMRATHMSHICHIYVMHVMGHTSASAISHRKKYKDTFWTNT